MAPGKRSGKVDEVMAGATEKVLKQITELYETGLSGATGGSLGLKAIAENPLLGMKLLKPRKKVMVMVVGNHSAGKSSFINWYTGDSTQKTGVAIETRGFTFVTSGKKRDTLTGEATMRFYDHLQGLGDFSGIMANVFTEISASKDKNFSCVDFVDTPGLVDGDMQYPFNVQDAIVWMADHVDLILIFFDPIGQATCKRTMEVVERLNQSHNVEKLHYFMSKADAVDKEHDRQRVLIQITQNLATRIRNSHAFNLPTFYLPRDDSDGSVTIPNAINDVCQEIDKSINMTVQKYLKNLKTDCEKIQARIDERLQEDRLTKSANLKRTVQGLGLSLLTLGGMLLTATIILSRVSESLCGMRLFNMIEHCETSPFLQHVRHANRDFISAHFTSFLGAAAVLTLVLLGMTLFTWRTKPVLTKKDIKKMEEYRKIVAEIGKQEKGLYDEYFKTLATMEH